MHSVSEFVNLLSSHPFYSTAKQDYVIDITGLPSAVLKSKLPNKVLHSLHYIGPYTEDIEEKLVKGNAKGFDFYYRLNFHRIRGDKAIRGADITNVLFIGLDLDYKLPASIDYIMTQAGLHPWAIIQTSIEPRKKFKKYQVLLAIDPQDSQRLSDCQEVGRLACDVIGGDIVCDLPRIFRLSGLKNWKGAEKGLNSGIATLLPVKRAGKVYKLDELKRLLELARLNPIVQQCKAASPRPTTDTSHDEYSRLFYLDYRKALEMVEGGEVVAHEGERYAALVSFAGGIAYDVGLGKVSSKDGHKTLDKLVSKGFEGGADERKVAGVHRFLDQAAINTAVKKAEELKEAVSELTSLTLTSTSSNDTGNHFSVVSNRDRFFRELLSNPSSEFIEAVFNALQVIKANDGYVSGLVWCLLEEAAKKKLMVEQFFCVPGSVRTKWGKVRHRQLTFTEDVEEGLLGELAERVYKSVLEHTELLSNLPTVKEQLSDIERSIRKANTGPDGIIDEAAFIREYNAAKVKFFTFKFTRILRRYIAGELAHAIKELQQQHDSIIDENRIAFQNCSLLLVTSSSGYSVREEEAWRTTLSCMDTILDYELMKKAEHLTEELLMTECPLMYSFLQDTFPGQSKTWMLVFNIIGYCFLVNNPLQVFFNFQGVGGSGKGSLGKIITYLCGRSADHVSFSGMAQDTGGLYNCIGKTVVVVDEVDSGLMDKKIKGTAWSKLKMVTGDTPIAVRQLYRNEIKVRLGTKFVLISNEPLQLPDTSGAGERRIISLKFNEPVAVTKQREDIALDVLREEADKVASIAAGVLASRWKLGRGMFEVKGSKALEEGRAEYLESSAPVRAYMSELIVIDENGLVSVEGLIACVDAFMQAHNDSQQAAHYLTLSDKKREELIVAYLKSVGVERTHNSRAMYDKIRFRAFTGIRLDYSKVNLDHVILPEIAVRLGNRMFRNYN